MYKTILFNVENRVARITLNRPPMNPLNSLMFREIKMALEKVEQDGGIKVIVLTGAGEKAFAAGADVSEMAGLSTVEAYEFTKMSREVFEKLESIDIPTIAAINGYALGGGLELALCCDFRLAADNAKLGLPEINLGIIPGGGGTQRISRLVGSARAKELIFLGEIIDARTAERMGIVNKVVDGKELENEVRALVEKLLNKPLVALKMAKIAINYGMNMDTTSSLRFETHVCMTAFASSDRMEGMKSFLEKRKPVFSDK